jgi:hypothetical protein
MRRLFVLVSMLAAMAMTGTAAMADGLNINWREARVVKLAQPATSVVVGDPTVADVTLEDPQLLLVFGRMPGETNLIVLNADQELLLDWSLIVSPESDNHVAVVNATGAPAEVLYACGTGRCARVLSPSDVEYKANSNLSVSADADASKSSTTTENTKSGANLNTASPQQSN